jgi:hypothetical protein
MPKRGMARKKHSASSSAKGFWSWRHSAIGGNLIKPRHIAIGGNLIKPRHIKNFGADRREFNQTASYQSILRNYHCHEEISALC